MLSIGIDLGTSSVKVSVLDIDTGCCLASSTWPPQEASILAPHPGWAEQSPLGWWDDVKQAILRCHAQGSYPPHDIAAIGIAYQMHGLVLVDQDQNPLRNSIIWCDGRAVEIGNKAFTRLGKDFCLKRLLNSPGNFTAAKLAWVRLHEPELFRKVDAFMLPGDFVAMKLTGTITTTPSALSEGILWDFEQDRASSEVMEVMGIPEDLVPEVRPVFAVHGNLDPEVAGLLSLKPGIPVSYKAGDQLNNALSLNVFQPGEVAATAGTSGVIFAVTDQPFSDPHSRVNSFAHVNHLSAARRVGVLLCINGAGILNRWLRENCGGLNYNEMNRRAAGVPPGSDGLLVLPFGNGPERMLNNQHTGSLVLNLDLNTHTKDHLFRAGQEGVACAFRYGLDIMRENGIQPSIIRAGRTNLFLSPVFTQAFVEVTGIPVELHQTDGSQGAALGAAMGAGFISSPAPVLAKQPPLSLHLPENQTPYQDLYSRWKSSLEHHLTSSL